jgi:hypothetical protein
MTSLDDVAAIAANEHHLAVVATLRADSTIQASVVNGGILAHPATGRPALAFVTFGRVKLAHLRARPQVAVNFRHGWRRATVEGRAQVAGPNDPQPWLADDDQLRLLLRGVRRGRRSARELAGIRPRHGRAAAHRRVDRSAPDLQQPIGGAPPGPRALRLRRSPRPVRQDGPGRVQPVQEAGPHRAWPAPRGPARASTGAVNHCP